MKFRGTKLSRRTLALLAAAAIMLGSSGFTGTKAALTVFSPNYDATIQTNTLGVELTEKLPGEGQAKDIADKGSFKLVKDDKKALAIGKPYTDTIGVRNSGTAPEYVRVIVRKYWYEKDKTAKTDKTLELKPDWIELTAAEGWKEVAGTNKEYSVYYRSKPLAVGESATLFTGFRISHEVKTAGKKITITDKDGNKTEYDSDAAAADKAQAGDTITYSYTYDGCTFNIEAEAQGLQTHNYQDAMKSVWGVKASDVL